MSIKILHVIDHLGYGGAPIVVKNIVERLNSNDIETFVCSLRTNPEAIPIKTTLFSLTFKKYNPFSFRAIAKLCKENKVDIIHTHLQKSVISGLLAARFCNAKIIIHEHGPIFRGGTGCIYRFLLKMLKSKITAAIANSQATKTALHERIGLPEKSIHVVKNFIDTARFEPKQYDRNTIRAKLNVNSDDVLIGFVGRLDYCKGIDLLIRAVHSLCQTNQNYRLIIVGDGAQKEQLKNLTNQLGITDMVTFTGLSRNPAELISAFDIAVIPSRREAFGITAVEFMHMKIPVIASKAGGLPELIQNNETGLLLENLAPGDIAQTITRLEQDNNLRESLIRNAEVCSRKFDGKEQLRNIEKIYQDLTGRRVHKDAKK